jgi:hypothetical protein
MTRHVLVLCLSAWTLAGCRGANPEQQLRDSFIQQIASTTSVRDFQRHGDEVLFTLRYGEHPDAKWRVHVDSVSIERAADGTAPSKGMVKSSWYADGEQIRPRGSQSDLPLAFLDRGIAQECWALWEKNSGEWSWQ